ncbi:MAG: glycoside hydrolase family 65 protein [Nocardioidaceae bacterium]
MNGWLFSYHGYDPADEMRREALCTLGNGFFATRGAAPESRADGVHYPGTYAAGIYDRATDEVDGAVIENESLVNLPNWLALTFGVGGQWLDLALVELLGYHQELDLRHGLLTRRFRFRDREDRVTAVIERRFVHMALPHLGGLQTTITPENWSGRLQVRTWVDGTVQNTGVARYRTLSGRHLGETECSHHDGCDLLTVHTLQSRLRIAVAARTRVRPPGDLRAHRVRELSAKAPCIAGHELAVEVSEGQPVTIEKLVAIYTSRDPAISEPGTEAVEELRRVGGFEDLLRPHRRAWDRLWRVFGVEITDNPELPDDFLASVRLGLFHLLQTVSPHSRELDVGVPARGLHGEAYRGHVFWDELFVMPVVWMRDPGLSRALLLYRYRRLPAARRAAQDAGHRGAMFPWQSGSDGREESQRLHLNPTSGHWLPDVTDLQRHSGLAVALSAWRFYETTGDVEFLCDYAAELVLEVALFFGGLAHYDFRRGRFVVTGVVGPDEFHTGYPDASEPGIDNNAYTNVLVVWLVRTALKLLDLLPRARRSELVRNLGITARDLGRWRRLATQMLVPFHDGMLSQFDGYADLAELDWAAYRARYGDISRLDRILEAEGDSVNRYKASKQADVLMLFYLFTADELDDLLTGLGYEFDRAGIPATIDYYLARTCHGSTLSSLVHAWVLARAHRDQALGFLLDVVQSDVHSTRGGTTAEGIHLAAMVAGADLLQRCFAGVEARLDSLDISPRWPGSLGRMVFLVRYQNQELQVTIGAGLVRVTSEPGEAKPVLVRCRGQSHHLHPGATLEITVPVEPVREERHRTPGPSALIAPPAAP